MQSLVKSNKMIEKKSLVFTPLDINGIYHKKITFKNENLCSNSSLFIYTNHRKTHVHTKHANKSTYNTYTPFTFSQFSYGRPMIKQPNKTKQTSKQTYKQKTIVASQFI